MKAISYYSFIDTKNKNTLNACNAASDKYPIQVNCTGVFSNERRFNSDNPSGRSDYYFMYVISGRLEVLTEGNFVECTQGSLIIFPPEKRYAYRHTESGNVEYFFVHFTGSEVEKLLRECEIAIHPAINRINHSETLIPRFQNMFDAFARQDALRDREVAAIFEQILIRLARRKSVGNDEYARSLSRSIGKMLSGYSQSISVPELAELESLSVSRYNTIFRQKMGCSPVEFLTATRMTAACELILFTDMSVKEIGAVCGYRDPHFFAKTFKKRFGVTPSEYRAGKRES